MSEAEELKSNNSTPPTDKALNDMSYVTWLPYLDMKLPHPLDTFRDDKLLPAKEIYSFFKNISPEDPFSSFRDFVAQLPAISNKPKHQQIMDAIKIMQIARSLY